MLRRSHLSSLGLFLFPFALHCGNTPDDGSRIGGGGTASSTGTGGDPSGGGASGVGSGGFAGLDFGWASEPDAGALGGPDGGAILEGCGDGIQQSGEACDDGNSLSADGCSATCGALEQDFACPTPGEACVSTVRCGDGAVTGAETCDDGNSASGDGCSETCVPEAGWTCRVAGARCEASACGDGFLAGDEECEDGNDVTTDGCDDCHRQPGFACVASDASPPSTCHTTTCNDGNKEGDEACDDHNDVVGDGCNPFCQVEPSCTSGGCQSACGDGMRLPDDDEACDDGNTLAGDGCSPTCQIEPGFTCTRVQTDLPDVLELPVTFRDFISSAVSPATRHPDFQFFSGGGTRGLVEAALGTDKKPVYTGSCDTGDATVVGTCPNGPQMTTEANFNQWYRDVPAVNKTLVTTLSMDKTAPTSDVYQFPATLGSQLFPLDGAGWVAAGSENTLTSSETTPAQHNFGFTSEIRHWFEFKGGERLTFSGDDDVWVFINGRLALDLGGMHPRLEQTIVLDADTGQALCTVTTNGVDTATPTPCPIATRDLDLNVGSVYEMALFHAERHTGFSNFDLTLGGFVSKKDVCVSVCGDGVRTPDEVCDDGVNNGAYGTCAPGCVRAPSCGDGVVQTDDGEACDDGHNLDGYGTGCAPGCKLPATCGDGEINGVFGEQCDDGANNDGHYGGCKADCHLAPRCGDGTRQESEACDDGNLLSGDGCSNLCLNEGPR
jgi:fibro-slime domain-containing protein